MPSEPNYEPIFYWVREREAILKKRQQGLPAPWTDDPHLREWRFCNVRREDDWVTVWIRKNIREAHAGHPLLWLMLCIARQICWPDTLQYLIDTPGAWPSHDTFTPTSLGDALNERKESGAKVYTGAYMIPAPQEKGSDKQMHIALNVIGKPYAQKDRFAWLFSKPDASLCEAHRMLSGYKGWGDFLAYQAIVDMRFTPLLSNAPDRETWCAAGPGTLRGLNRIYGRPLDKKIDQSQARQEIRKIYAVVRDATGVDMDFSDVPNILCETDKYLRLQNGEGEPRARYVSQTKVT